MANANAGKEAGNSRYERRAVCKPQQRRPPFFKPKFPAMTYRLTSSKFSAVIGNVHAQTSQQNVYREALGIAKPRSKFAERQAGWGKQSEPLAVRAAIAATGLFFSCTGDNQKSFGDEYFGTTPDGVYELPGLRIGLEVKCPTKQRKELMNPKHAMPQIQGQCKLANLDGVYFAVWEPRKPLRLFYVERCREYWYAMAPTLERFRQSVIRKEAPKQWSTKKNPKPVMPPTFWRLATV